MGVILTDNVTCSLVAQCDGGSRAELYVREMAEALDFRHPDQPSLESTLHPPHAVEMETYVEDLNPNQVGEHCNVRCTTRRVALRPTLNVIQLVGWNSDEPLMKLLLMCYSVWLIGLLITVA